MASRGFNVCTLSGNVAADPEYKTITLKNNTQTYLRKFSMYVDRVPKRHDKDHFIVDVTVWENSAADRKMDYVSTGSLVIVTGSIDASPYISKADNTARAGLQLKAVDIFLDASPRNAEQPQDSNNYDEVPF